MKTTKKSQKQSDTLGRAVEAWKASDCTTEVLGVDARSRILTEAVRGNHHPAPLPRLFTPLRRLVMAGALPVLLTGALVGLGTWQGPSQTRIEALKQGDSVVFNIANGSRSHVVYTSNQPDRFDPSTRQVVTDGTFVDQTQVGGADIVFYRID